MPVAPPAIDQFAKIMLRMGPLCHWAIDEHCRFTQAAGDTARLFQQPPEDLTGRRISEVSNDRMALRWVLALGKVFAGEALVEEFSFGESSYFVTHLPVRNEEGQVLFAAGFAHDPCQREAEPKPVNGDFQRELQAARVKTADFLHDDVAQSLSAAGLQLDLLRMDLESTVPEIAPRTAEIQGLLDGALRRVREFNVGYLRPGA
jgi:signal transduction histidine kinase